MSIIMYMEPWVGKNARSGSTPRTSRTSRIAGSQDRRIDFADLDAAFDGRFAIVVEDKRRDYGEQRFNMLVELYGVILHITFTPRPPRERIISARIASRKERRTYHAK